MLVYLRELVEPKSNVLLCLFITVDGTFLEYKKACKCTGQIVIILSLPIGHLSQYSVMTILLAVTLLIVLQELLL